MQTVIGLYRTVAEANQVKQALLSEGFSGGDVTVIDQSESGYEGGYGAGAGSGVTGLTGLNTGITQSTVGSGFGGGTGTATASGTSVGDKIKHFFSGLTGSDEQTHSAYTQGVSNGGAMVAVNVSEGQVDRVSALLRQHGASDIENEGGAGYGASTGTTAGYDRTVTNVSGEQVIPIVEEELVVGKRQVERGGVRVFSRVVSEPVSESVSLHEERVIVDRRPVDRPATSADFTDAGPIEVRAMGEEAVVGKAGRVVEEVVVGKAASDRTETVQDSVRRTEVDVEPVQTSTTTTGTSTTGTTGTFGTGTTTGSKF